MSTSTNQLWRTGKKHVSGFVGVFPLDKVPHHISKPFPKSFIVNTDTSNLPGKHWLAVSLEPNGIIFVFDPMGYFYPYLLVNHLKKMPHRKIIYNYHCYQKPWQRNCGWHCLAFLKSRVKGYKQ